MALRVRPFTCKSAIARVITRNRHSGWLHGPRRSPFAATEAQRTCSCAIAWSRGPRTKYRPHLRSSGASTPGLARVSRPWSLQVLVAEWQLPSIPVGKQRRAHICRFTAHSLGSLGAQGSALTTVAANPNGATRR